MPTTPRLTASKSPSVGDSWLNEVPLGEETEEYEVAINDGVDVVPTLHVTYLTALYTAAQDDCAFLTLRKTQALAIEICAIAIDEPIVDVRATVIDPGQTGKDPDNLARRYFQAGRGRPSEI